MARARRVLSVMFLNCFFGPQRNIVEDIDTMFPKVKRTAQATGLKNTNQDCGFKAAAAAGGWGIGGGGGDRRRRRQRRRRGRHSAAGSRRKVDDEAHEEADDEADEPLSPPRRRLGRAARVEGAWASLGQRRGPFFRGGHGSRAVLRDMVVYSPKSSMMLDGSASMPTFKANQSFNFKFCMV